MGAAAASDDDRLLAARLGAGDERALTEAYERHAAVLFGLARKVTGSAAAAEDVVQEVFVQLWRDPLRFDPSRGSLRTWLTVLTHRRAVDVVRSEAARAKRQERDASGTVAAPAVAEEATALALGARVRRALDRLPAEQRQVIDLAYFGGCSYREAALRLGIPEGTAKSRVRLALARLADLLDGEGLAAWT
jgi:RNA polymerase sigma-70 factor (ECF subfamily)